MSLPDKLMIEHVAIAIGTAIKEAFEGKGKPISEIARIAINAVDEYRNKQSDFSKAVDSYVDALPEITDRILKSTKTSE